MRASVKTEVPKFLLLRQRLLADFPNLDEETLTDTLEGITDLNEMIAAVIRSALVDEVLHAGLRFRLDDMKERLSRLGSRADKSGSRPRRHERGRAQRLEQPDFDRLSPSGVACSRGHR